MSLDLNKTPLGAAHGLGSAKDGTGHWWGQRVSAILMIPLLVFLLISFLQLESFDHIFVRMWLKQPLVAASMITLVLSMFFHSESGTQTVVEDYVHGKSKVLLLLLLKFLHLLIAVIAIIAILRVALT